MSRAVKEISSRYPCNIKYLHCHIDFHISGNFSGCEQKAFLSVAAHLGQEGIM